MSANIKPTDNTWLNHESFVVDSEILAAANRLLEIGKDCAAHVKGNRTLDHADLLYDEKGLPLLR